MRQFIANLYSAVALMFLRANFFVWNYVLLLGLKLKKIDPHPDYHTQLVKELSSVIKEGGGKIEDNDPETEAMINAPMKALLAQVKERRVYDRKSKNWKSTRPKTDETKEPQEITK